jgi:hypothetical protein
MVVEQKPKPRSNVFALVSSSDFMLLDTGLVGPSQLAVCVAEFQ